MDEVMRKGSARFAVGCALTAIAAGPASQPTVQPTPPAPVTNPPAFPMADLTNDLFHFHLKYPRDWKLLDPAVNNQVISMQTVPTDPKDPAFGVVGLRIQTGPETASDPQILKDISGEMVDYTFNHGGKKVTINPDKLGDLPARRIVFDIDNPDAGTRVMCIVAVRHRDIYVFTVAASTRKFDQMLPGVEEMLRSFDLSE